MADKDPKPEDAALDALWRQIEPRLPACLRDDPKTPGRIGFLLGLGVGNLASQIARKLLGVNDDET
jgi:hypothetical protein